MHAALAPMPRTLVSGTISESDCQTRMGELDFSENFLAGTWGMHAGYTSRPHDIIAISMTGRYL